MPHVRSSCVSVSYYNLKRLECSQSSRLLASLVNLVVPFHLQPHPIWLVLFSSWQGRRCYGDLVCGSRIKARPHGQVGSSCVKGLDRGHDVGAGAPVLDCFVENIDSAALYVPGNGQDMSGPPLVESADGVDLHAVRPKVRVLLHRQHPSDPVEDDVVLGAHRRHIHVLDDPEYRFNPCWRWHEL